MTLPKVLDKLVHHHEKPHHEEAKDKEPQRDSVDTEAPLNPPAEASTPPQTATEQLPTPPVESNHHGFLHKLAHPLEKKSHEEERPHEKKEHHHHHHHHHEDPVYAHHAVDPDAEAPAKEESKPLQVSTDAPPADAKTPPHHPSSPLHKGWEKIKKIAHDHHESANESFDGYYGALTEGAQATSPDRRASTTAEAGPSAPTKPEEHHEAGQPHETKEHAIERLGAIEREKHHKEHTLGYGVAAV